MRGLMAMVLGVFLLAACNEAECPPGQAESADGECLLGQSRMCNCGDNAHYDFTMQACLPDYPTVVCGAGARAVVQSDGTQVCERVPEGVAPVTLLPGAQRQSRPGTTVMPGSQAATVCCGPGTENQNGACVASHPETRCDLTTTVAVDTDSGITVCEPIDPESCPSLCNATPEPGNVTICGQLIDTETNRDIGATVGIICDPSQPTATGPCSLTLRVYDALTFANQFDPQMPDAVAQLPHDSVQVNECGQFAIHNVAVPTLGFIAVSVDDSSLIATDEHVLSGVALDASGANRVQDLPLYVVTQATDQTWTQTAGDPFGGRSFSEAGAMFMLFLDQNGEPAPGVQVAVSGDAPQGIYYFSDSDPYTRATVDPAATMTGVNGAALVMGSSLLQHSGSGGEPAGCAWERALATTLEGVVFATERRLECQ